jgi:hypothetical protein
MRIVTGSEEVPNMSKSALHADGIRWNRLLPAILATIALACAIGLAGCGQTDTAVSSSEAASSTAAPSEGAPDKPEGNEPPEKPEGNEPPAKPEGGQPGGSGGPGQGSDTVNNGTGATTLSSEVSETGQTYNSTNADENALRAESGAKATIEDATITKTNFTMHYNNRYSI